MATFDAHSDVLETTITRAQPELLVSAVLHLMSHYHANTNDSGVCVKLASVIERHLKALASLPDLAPVLRATCQQLAEQWALIVDCTIPQPTPRSFFERLVVTDR